MEILKLTLCIQLLEHYCQTSNLLLPQGLLLIPGWSNYTFQSSFRDVIALSQSFHDYVALILIVIVGVIIIIGADLLSNKHSIINFHDYRVLEIWWTVVPGVVLIIIALPSLRLLYLIDEIENSNLTINTLGHQWFWEYNMPNYTAFIFESYIKSNSQRTLRLLDVDNRLIIPSDILCRMVVSASDVLHAWTLPSIGVKVDAVPGRLNQIGLERFGVGVIHGQCSEICGANHRFIPIVVESVPIEWWLRGGSELRLGCSSLKDESLC